MRIVLKDIGDWSGNLSGETINDDDSHGIGNDSGLEYGNQSAWWFGTGKLQRDCHAESSHVLS